MKYTLVLDQSTSATKAMLFDLSASLIERVSVEHKQYYPKAGWVEHDPQEILQNSYTAVQLLLEKSGQKPSEIESLALTNQRETVVVWNKTTGKPLYNAVVWQCNRGSAYCEQLIRSGKETVVRKKTGLLLNPYFSASGVKWILDHIKEARECAVHDNLLIGTIDSWLIWNFTSDKIHATDYTNASRTLLFNIHTLDWDEELLELFSIDRSMLPRILPCDSVFGQTTLNGLLPEIPLAGVIGDSHGALVGQCCFERGMGKATYGTGSSIMINMGEKVLSPPAGLVTSVAFAACGRIYYAFEGNIHCTGATIKWMEEELGLIQSTKEAESLAMGIEDNGDVYFVPAFAGLGAPWWDNDARALICGMSRGTTKAHLVRAALESIAYQVKDLIDLIVETGVSLKELRVDGGPVKNNFLMQFQADMLQTPINRSPIEEASALGAVLINRFALKKWTSVEEAAALRKTTAPILPTMDAKKQEALYVFWKKAVQRATIK